METENYRNVGDRVPVSHPQMDPAIQQGVQISNKGRTVLVAAPGL